MKKFTNMLTKISNTNYAEHFWNAMRGNKNVNSDISVGVDNYTGAYTLAPASTEKYMNALRKESLFRSIATNVSVYDYEYRIKTMYEKDIAAWVTEGGSIPLGDGMEDFGDLSIDIHKLTTFFKLDEAFVKDATFDIENYMASRFAKNFAKAEDAAFINGDGVTMPTGILSDNGGAEIGVTSDTITYETIVKLFFSLKPEYRKNAVWLINDETAMALRTLKDEGGNYVWNHTNDTIFGKKVLISEYMPSVDTGNKPIAFGDFSYYLIVNRRPISVKVLLEQFALIGSIGYLAFELLDGKLIRPDAVKLLKVGSSSASEE